MVRTSITGFKQRPDVNVGTIFYVAYVSYIDTLSGFQWEDEIKYQAADTDSPAQVQANLVAAVKAGGESHGLTMAGTVGFFPTYNKVTF